MKLECKDFSHLIDSYLSSSIAEEKQEAFELHYFECDGCFAELKAAERLKAKEVPIVAPVPGQQKVRAFRWKPLMVFGTLFLVVLASVFVLQQPGMQDKNEWTEMTGFEPPVYISKNTRGQGLAGAPTFSQAMQQYNLKNYTTALTQLKQIPDASSNPQVIFFKGICQLQTDQPEPALESFNAIIESMNPSYYDEAIYYKAITLLRLNKKQEALKQLKNLSEMFSPYAQKAKDLMAKIK